MPAWKPPTAPTMPARQAIAEWLRTHLDDSVVSDQSAPARVKRAIMKVPAAVINKALPLLGWTETPENLTVADLPMPGAMAISPRQLRLPVDWPRQRTPKTLYWGSTLRRAILPDPQMGRETPLTAFATDNPDIADIFTLPREYGEVVTHTSSGRPLNPGVVTEFDYYPGSTYELAGADAQRFIDDSAYQQRLANAARAKGHDAIVAKQVREGVGDQVGQGDVYALLNSSGMRRPRKFR